MRICVTASLSFLPPQTPRKGRVWRWGGMKSCWFPLFRVFFAQKVPIYDSGFESWHVRPPLLIFLCWEEPGGDHSGKSSHLFWFVMLNLKQTKKQAPQNFMNPKFNLKSGWHYFFFKSKQKGLIFGGVGEKPQPKTELSFSGTGHEAELWGKVRGFCAFAPLLCSGSCFH